MAAAEIDSLFSTPMPIFLEIPSRIQSTDQNHFTEIAHEMINFTEHFGAV